MRIVKWIVGLLIVLLVGFYIAMPRLLQSDLGAKIVYLLSSGRWLDSEYECIRRPRQVEGAVMVGSFAYDAGCMYEAVSVGGRFRLARDVTPAGLEILGWSDEAKRTEAVLIWADEILLSSSSLVERMAPAFVFSDTPDFQPPDVRLTDTGGVILDAWVNAGGGMVPAEFYSRYHLEIDRDGNIVDVSRGESFEVYYERMDDLSTDEGVLASYVRETREEVDPDQLCIMRPETLVDVVLLGDADCNVTQLLLQNDLVEFAEVDEVSAEILASNGWLSNDDNSQLAIAYATEIIANAGTVIWEANEDFLREDTPEFTPPSAETDEFDSVRVVLWYQTDIDRYAQLDLELLATGMTLKNRVLTSFVINR